MKTNTFIRIGALSFVASLATNASAATLSFIDDVPATDVLLQSNSSEDPQGSAASQGAFGYRNADASGTDGTRGRGQSFLFSTGSGDAYNISSLAVSLNGSAGNAVRPDGDLIVTVFEWDDSSDPENITAWDADTGASGGTELFNGSFAIDAGTSLTNTQVLEIGFNTGELVLQDGVAYGVFFRYVLDDVTGLTSDVSIAFDVRQDSNFDGYLLNTNVGASFAAADNGQSTSRDMNLTLTGTAVPEPSSMALLGLGGLALILRRRK